MHGRPLELGLPGLAEAIRQAHYPDDAAGKDRARIRLAFDVHNLTQDRRSARAWTVLATTDPEGDLQVLTPAELRTRLGVDGG